MSWDRKRRGRGAGYYYRSARTNGKVVKEYLGTGKKAQQAARQVEERRVARIRMREEEVRLASLDPLMEKFRAWAGLLVRAYLIAGGCYDHKGQWRRRGRRQGRPAASAT